MKTMRFYRGDAKTDPRWRNRWVEVLVRASKGAANRNALVRFDSGEEVVVPTYAGGGVGATLRKTETISEFTEEEFERLFRHRGIDPEVVEDAFYRYERDGDVDPSTIFTGEMDPARINAAAKYGGRCERLASKSAGIMMRRWPVPEAEPFIFSEQRPDRAIWTGDVTFPSWMGGIPEPHVHSEIFSDADDRAAHVGRNRDAPAAVFRGMTLDEYRVVADEEHFGEPNYGGDHFGEDTDEPHVHVKVAKYVFTPNERAWVEDPDGPHDHSEYRTAWRRMAHETFHHTTDGTPVDADQRSFWSDYRKWLKGADDGDGYDVAQMMAVGEHEHHRETDVSHYAARLSWHPHQRDERWQRDRVLWCLEGSLKEAAAVSVGEATVSCPSITLWNAPELPDFARKHLQGKFVYVVTDADWNPGVRRLHDDMVISQALLLVDTLRRYGVEAYVAAPPLGADGRIRVADDGCDLKGFDDFVGHGGTVHDLVVVDVIPSPVLREWLRIRREGQRGRWEEGLGRDLEVLTWLARFSANGRDRKSIRSITAHIQHRLEAPPKGTDPAFEAKVETVRLAVESLRKQGAVIVRGSLRDRGRTHFRRRRAEWTGSIELADDLRSEVQSDTTIGQLEARRDRHG